MAQTTIERAIELARSGKFITIGEIRKQLQRELFESPARHIEGKATRTQLKALMAEARTNRIE